ncbi:hypothetical protein VNO77_23351 [Canavalia gladiata]|uniref:Uncharacterized protein n=1 Tax=Canavalia gladiata TaxID=3824 RepID=A0AAN9L5N7_CANGL
MMFGVHMLPSHSQLSSLESAGNIVGEPVIPNLQLELLLLGMERKTPSNGRTDLGERRLRNAKLSWEIARVECHISCLE